MEFGDYFMFSLRTCRAGMFYFRRVNQESDYHFIIRNCHAVSTAIVDVESGDYQVQIKTCPAAQLT